MCGALAFLIQTLRKVVDPNVEVEIGEDTVPVGSILQHADELYRKLMQEKEAMGGGDMVQLTRTAYIELMKKIEIADRIAAEPMMEAASAGIGRPC
jgi:hypothetical protein